MVSKDRAFSVVDSHLWNSLTLQGIPPDAFIFFLPFQHQGEPPFYSYRLSIDLFESNHNMFFNGEPEPSSLSLQPQAASGSSLLKDCRDPVQLGTSLWGEEGLLFSSYFLSCNSPWGSYLPHFGASCVWNTWTKLLKIILYTLALSLSVGFWVWNCCDTISCCFL